LTNSGSMSLTASKTYNLQILMSQELTHDSAIRVLVMKKMSKKHTNFYRA
jgi:hypothetical protein